MCRDVHVLASTSCFMMSTYGAFSATLNIFPEQARVAEDLFNKIVQQLEQSLDSFENFKVVIQSANQCSLVAQTTKRLEAFINAIRKKVRFIFV